MVAKAAQYLFDDSRHARRLYLRAMEVSRFKIRSACQYIQFLMAHDRSSEVMDLASKWEDSENGPFHSALLAATLHAVGKEAPKQLLINAMVTAQQFSPGFRSILADTAVIYCIQYIRQIKDTETDADQAHHEVVRELGANPETTLGFARFVELTANLNLAMKYYREAYHKGHHSFDVALPYLRAMGRAERQNELSLPELITGFATCLVENHVLPLPTLGIGFSHLSRRWLIDLLSRSYWEVEVKRERRGNPWQFILRKQYFVYLQSRQMTNKVESLRREFRALQAIM